MKQPKFIFSHQKSKTLEIIPIPLQWKKNMNEIRVSSMEFLGIEIACWVLLDIFQINFRRKFNTLLVASISHSLTKITKSKCKWTDSLVHEPIQPFHLHNAQNKNNTWMMITDFLSHAKLYLYKEMPANFETMHFFAGDVCARIGVIRLHLRITDEYIYCLCERQVEKKKESRTEIIKFHNKFWRNTR